MRNHRNDVVEKAIDVLDTYGLADLTMRRLASELGVQPSALYHHFANKQALLGAVADELLSRRVSVAETRDPPWDERAAAICVDLREAMLAYRDGAELVSTVHAFGLGAQTPYAQLVTALHFGDVDPDLARTAARTLLHYVFGHTIDEQTHLQATSVGAIDDELRPDSDFLLGLTLILDGLRLRTAGIAPARTAKSAAWDPPRVDVIPSRETQH